MPALVPALVKAGITTPRRLAAFLGQCSVEAGPAFAELAENTRYTSPGRLLEIFPSRVHTLAQANALVLAGAAAIANCIYAGKLGNGDEASGDGWRFRGAGLLQLTGRGTIAEFAREAGMTPEDAADWLRVPGGAASGSCWYWTRHGINALADRWDITGVTRAINGAGMMAQAERDAACRRALEAIFG